MATLLVFVLFLYICWFVLQVGAIIALYSFSRTFVSTKEAIRKVFSTYFFIFSISIIVLSWGGNLHYKDDVLSLYDVHIDKKILLLLAALLCVIFISIILWMRFEIRNSVYGKSIELHRRTNDLTERVNLFYSVLNKRNIYVYNLPPELITEHRENSSINSYVHEYIQILESVENCIDANDRNDRFYIQANSILKQNFIAVENQLGLLLSLQGQIQDAYSHYHSAYSFFLKYIVGQEQIYTNLIQLMAVGLIYTQYILGSDYQEYLKYFENLFLKYPEKMQFIYAEISEFIQIE